jgi:putative restriction endonuclease
MRIFVGVTDGDWFEQLSLLPNIDEVNFWQPSGSTKFRALSPGELFLFKLHSPRNFIVGGGLFAHFSALPVSLAWAAFEIKNGARSLPEMRRRIEKYRRQAGNHTQDYTIGCILLEQPFFFPEELWIPVPEDWAKNIVRGKGYETSTETGRQLWERVADGLQLSESAVRDGEATRFGDPVPIRPRLGQGSFRVLVTDIYHRRCAITRERTLPVLQAAHIKPYAEGGGHDVRNGLLLRSDIHVLFDQGYVTVTPDLRFEVSRRIREEFENGRDYYALHGRAIHAPTKIESQPDPSLLSWHNGSVFKG